MFSIYASFLRSHADDPKLKPRQSSAFGMKQGHTSSFIRVDRYCSKLGPFGFFNIASTQA